ncbi:MAG: efflux RND transporter periplasmic adaptor subunit [Prevotellaceae bacterium]|jgi:membrane fusion protein (multidrug efflux system)|nr:efflux RND transporter periplasmic adaptor subunit [Prevotellaceae bacterium]
MSKTQKIILIVAIVLLIVGMAFFPAIKRSLSADTTVTEQKSDAKAGGQRPLGVNIQVLKKETLNNTFRTIGILLPDEEVDLSFETSGKITNIFFKEGAEVRQGQLLAKVNDKPLTAELAKINAQLPLAIERVNRQKTLLAKESVSQEAYEAVTTELEKLRADAELAKSRIAQTELRAPFDGIIGLRQVSEGAYASPTTPVAKLTKIAPLKLEFSVNEKQANDIKNGTEIQFTLENDARKYSAKVYAIESNLDRQTLTLKVRALYPNADRHLNPGRSVTVEPLLNRIENTIVVPSIAIIAEMGRDIVFVYRNGKATRTEVKKGLRTASSVQIVSGLNVGDTLITSGVMQLRDEMNVEIN